MAVSAVHQSFLLSYFILLSFLLFFSYCLRFLVNLHYGFSTLHFDWLLAYGLLVIALNSEVTPADNSLLLEDMM